MAEESDDEEMEEFGVTLSDLKKSVLKVRGKINVIKLRSQLKSKRRASSKIKKLNEMTEELKARGIKVNEETLASRVKNPRRIGELEAAQDKKAKAVLGESDESDDDDRDMIDDDDIREQEADKRGRKGRKDDKEEPKKLLGKRKAQKDIEMESSDNEDEDDYAKIIEQNIRGSKGKNRKS